MLSLIEITPEWTEAKFPVIPVETGISSIRPIKRPFGEKDGEPNQVLAGEFP
jgi:hypothetical protein